MVVVFGERHLRHLPGSYPKCYNDTRTLLSPHEDAPVSRAIETIGSTSPSRSLKDCIINASGIR